MSWPKLLFSHCDLPPAALWRVSSDSSHQNKRSSQGTEAIFFNGTTSAARRAPAAETRFDDLGGSEGGAQVRRLFESHLQGHGPKAFYPLTP
jgi:hypothetical protein